MNPKIEAYFQNSERWREELEKLRTIVLDCHLVEELKWDAPCYTFQKKNIVILGEFKDCCVLGFFKGALLKDAEGILSKPGENTQSARMVRFTSVLEIAKLEPILKAYIFEAVELEEVGRKVEFKKTAEYPVPEELQLKLAGNPALKAAFEALTPGRQRAYLLHFSEPKQARTREARIEKYTQQILEGKGLNDDYFQRRK